MRPAVQCSFFRRDVRIPEPVVEPVTLKHLRGVFAACMLTIAAAACGGADDETADSAAAAPAGDTTAAPAAAAAPEAAPPPAAATPEQRILDSAMTPQEAMKAAERVQVEGPVTVQAVSGYTLTMPKLRQLVQAGRNIAAVQERRPELRDSMRIPTMDPNALYERLSTIPDVRDAVQRAGLTPREYATATGALLQAIIVHEMRSRGTEPQGQFNEANVRFVGENLEEIQAMMRNAIGQQPGRPAS